MNRAQPMNPRRRATLTAAFLAALTLAACTAPGVVEGGRDSAPVPGPSAAQSAGPGAAARPATLTIDRLGITSTLPELGLDPDGTIAEPPVDQPQQAGWYRYSPVPGNIGPAVVLGHVNGGGRAGIFEQLHTLTAGDLVRIDLTDGTTVAYQVDTVEQIPKDEFPTGRVYGTTTDAQLRLITCGGVFDTSRGHYDDNVIVWATRTT